MAQEIEGHGLHMRGPGSIPHTQWSASIPRRDQKINNITNNNFQSRDKTQFRFSSLKSLYFKVKHSLGQADS